MRWDNVVKKTWKGLGGDQEEVLSTEKFGGYKTEVKEVIEERERLALRTKVKEEKHLQIYGGLREDIEMKTYLHSPMDLDLPERRKRYTSTSRREEHVAKNMCLCGTAMKSRAHIVGECELYKEERDGLEEMRQLDVCDMEQFGRLESSEKTIAILGDKTWPQTAKQDGNRISKQFLRKIWKKRNERPNVGGVSIRSRNGAPSRKGCVVNGQMT